MTPDQQTEPAEIIYLPGSSWAPPFLALGITLIVVGAYLSWPYAVVGAVLSLAAAKSWVSQTEDEVEALPRKQDPITDVVAPPTK